MSFEERLTLTKEAVDRPDYLLLAIGDGNKTLQENEKNTVIVQRRAVRAARNLEVGEILKREDLLMLRPCPIDGFPPYKISDLLGNEIKLAISQGEHLQSKHIV